MKYWHLPNRGFTAASRSGPDAVTHIFVIFTPYLNESGFTIILNQDSFKLIGMALREVLHHNSFLNHDLFQHMPRRKRWRTVSDEPPVSVFKPAGVPAVELEEILITLDEFETVKLADFEGMNQREASAIMHVSQPTFNRILSSARSKIAKALVQGCVLRIEGGRYVLGDGTGGLECIDCGDWVDLTSSDKSSCPKCGSTRLHWTRFESPKR